MNIDGLLLCSECENQLTVRPYKGGHGFFVVERCVYCAATEQGVAAELLSLQPLMENASSATSKSPTSSAKPQSVEL